MTMRGTDGRAVAPGVRLGRMAVAADLVLAVALTSLLLGITHDSLDAVPRPLALLALYATPGIVGALGVRGRRSSLLFAAGVVLVPGSVLSFAGVTLIFALPLALFWAAAVTMESAEPRSPGIVAIAEVTIAVVLMVGAAVALFTTSWSGCSDSGSICGSGFLTLPGVVLELALVILAVGFAASRTVAPRGATSEHARRVSE